MPLYLDALVSFSLGIVWCQRLRDRPDLFVSRLSWPLVAQLAFQAIVLVPLQSFSFCFHHDWSTAYLIDPDRHPRFDGWLGLWALLAALTMVALATSGHFVGRVGFDKPRSQLATRLLIGAALVGSALVVFFFRELLYVGTYEEFVAGSARLWPVTLVGLSCVLELGACALFLYYGPSLLKRISQESAQLN